MAIGVKRRSPSETTPSIRFFKIFFHKFIKKYIAKGLLVGGLLYENMDLGV